MHPSKVERIDRLANVIELRIGAHAAADFVANCQSYGDTITVDRINHLANCTLLFWRGTHTKETP